LSDGLCTIWVVALLAVFRRTKVKLPGVSIDITAGQETQFEETQSAVSGTPFGYYCQNVFEMKNYSGAYTTRERGLFGIHYMNTTGGALDTTWTSADYAAAEAAVQAFWTGNPLYFSNGCRLVEHRWYAFGPEVVQPNPPARVTTITPIQGTTTSAWTRQVATSITMRTALRTHWGRFYLPTCESALYDTNGQMGTTAVDNFATLMRTMLLAAQTSQGVTPVVYDRNRKIAFSVSAIEVDSVPDIIRRRRPRDTGYKKILTA
jgi:hypothetical protein